MTDLTTDVRPSVEPGELYEALLDIRLKRDQLTRLRGQVQALTAELSDLETAFLNTCTDLNERPGGYDLRVREVRGRASTTYHERDLRLALEGSRPELLPAVFTRVETFKFNRRAAEALEEQIGGLDAYRTVTPGVNRLEIEDTRGNA
ncbi:hypothetical protein [Deinococcus knuensis]|uniref:Uncharacterized protein n=1 Tax=Deinococcus knuensis TaxID=1837380 RepID=A0ABQ2SRN3_9DEIO|nr:hypothetical protein [Deinococcus knuensis]GGS38173.1 hypothetical protein GCM10008961_32150 [Deinococcus knuensis]